MIIQTLTRFLAYIDDLKSTYPLERGSFGSVFWPEITHQYHFLFKEVIFS